MRRMTFAVPAGVALLVACASGDGGSANDRIPAVVFGGGAATLTIEVTTSAPAKVTAVFERGSMDDPDHAMLETWQDVEAGSHTFTVDVPENVSGVAEVGIEQPPVGATVELVCRVNGEFIQRDSARLEEPLEKGYGFFAQIAFDDFATGELSTD